LEHSQPRAEPSDSRRYPEDRRSVRNWASASQVPVAGLLHKVPAGDVRDSDPVEPAPESPLPTDAHRFRVELRKLHDYMIQRKARGSLPFRIHYDGQRAAKIVVEGLDVEILL